MLTWQRAVLVRRASVYRWPRTDQEINHVVDELLEAKRVNKALRTTTETRLQGLANVLCLQEFVYDMVDLLVGLDQLLVLGS